MTVKFEHILNEQTSLSAEVKSAITEAWEARIGQVKEELTAELREEFARKFAHDKEQLVEAMDKFLEEKIRSEIEEFAQDKRELAAERVQAKMQVKEHIEMLDKFLIDAVSKEVKELREDRRAIKGNLEKLEEFALTNLATEVKELREEKQALVRQKVKLISEAKKQLAETKKQFIKKASQIVDTNINSVLQEEIKQYKEDIDAARRNDFGRRLFEAFAAEYMTSHLNEGSELKKLKNILIQKEEALNEALSHVEEREALAENLRTRISVLEERVKRSSVMSELLAPLNKEKRGVMQDLLESVKTEHLKAAYNKYLPAVLDCSAAPASKKEALTESARAVKTGNRASSVAQQDDSSVGVDELRRLAGIK
ncbi:hypothetical protein Cassandra_0471 [Pseudomonas phage Cassandra]|nr:hypothetical protein Cassandra_0471 [Pseudomonas phage Cassandra]